MLRLYDNLLSGNGYKVRLALHRLGIPFERIELDILKGQTRTPEFLARNPNGRIPVLELEDGTVLAESNAILWYLAEGTALLPAGRLARAQVLQWLFFEQYSHDPYIAVVKFIRRHRPDDPRAAELPRLMAGGIAALGVMETQLRGRHWFVGAACSIADLALYAYTHMAEEGGFELAPFPALRAWLARVAALPGHVPITWR
jgi:glutathione S-transferase